MNGANRSKPLSWATNVTPASRQEAASSTSFSSDGFSWTGDFDGAVPEGLRDDPDGHAFQQQRHGRRVAEAV